jgi:hypothetical protein
LFLGTRINPHEIKSFLCRVDDVMDFTYEPCDNKLVFFINLPSTKFNKKVSFEWELERLSWVNMWTPIQTRVYDYLQYETELVQLVPIQFEPNSIGDRYVDDVFEVRQTNIGFVILFSLLHRTFLIKNSIWPMKKEMFVSQEDKKNFYYF